MARGHQKIQSQQKNAKKQAEQKKKQGHDQKTAAKAALVYTCSVCMTTFKPQAYLSTAPHKYLVLQLCFHVELQKRVNKGPSDY